MLVETSNRKELKNVDMDHDCSCCRDHLDQHHQKLQKVMTAREVEKCINDKFFNEKRKE